MKKSDLAETNAHIWDAIHVIEHSTGRDGTGSKIIQDIYEHLNEAANLTKSLL